MAAHAGIKWAPGGGIGVDIFFVLSGFLITSLIYQEWMSTDGFSFRFFYYRRALRLLPALFAVLAAWLVYCILFTDYPLAEVYQSIVFPLCYSTNWARAVFDFDLIAMNHTWSLSAEEQFYLVWPFCLIWLLRRKVAPRRILGILAVGVVLINVDRIWLFGHGAGVRRLYLGPDTHGDPILVGCIAGLVYSCGILPAGKKALGVLALLALVGGLVLTIFIIRNPPEQFFYCGGYTLISALIAIALLGLVLWPSCLPARVLSHPCAVWIGRLSYGLYLWHMPIYTEIGAQFARFHLAPRALTSVRITAAFSAAALCYYLIESPFLRLKHRFGSQTS